MRTDALWIGARAAMLVGMAAVLCVAAPLYAQTSDTEDEVLDLQVNEKDVGTHEADTSSAADEVTNSASQAGTPLGVSVTPVVANEKAKPRDILKKELLITNNTDGRVNLYISVRNIDPATGDQVATGPTESDLAVSLANWVEITRGVIDLSPGESRKIPYLIHVNLSARPGSYFARIAFHEGGNRAQAESGDPAAELVFNMEVIDDAHERLQLGGFTSADSVVLGKEVGFSYLLENVGNRVVEPRGSIRIFNRKGEEVGSVPLNADGEEISPENKRQLAATWAASGRFGKYKAFLDLEYGENQLASVQDTIYFWVFPWKEIFFAIMGVLVLGIIGTYIVHTRAMARPAPARVYRDAPAAPAYQPTEPAFGQQTVRPAVRTLEQTFSGGPTVLVERRSGTRIRTSAATPVPTPAERDNNVTVLAAPARPRVSTYGATVELAPRRR